MRVENDLYKWRMRHHISLLRAELVLGISRVTLLKYERGGQVSDLTLAQINRRDELLAEARERGEYGV